MTQQERELIQVILRHLGAIIRHLGGIFAALSQYVSQKV